MSAVLLVSSGVEKISSTEYVGLLVHCKDPLGVTGVCDGWTDCVAVGALDHTRVPFGVVVAMIKDFYPSVCHIFFFHLRRNDHRQYL